MTAPQEKLYGTWPSALTPAMLAASGSIEDVQWDSDGQTLVWLERRSSQTVLVAQSLGGAPRDLIDPAAYRISGGILYGGGEFTVAQGQVYFAAQGRLHRVPVSGGLPQAITPGFGAAAAPVVAADGQWIAYAHSYEEVDGICLSDTAGRIFPRKIAYGTDFVMQPAWHPRGTHLAYIAWNFPQMPFNGTELRLVTLAYDKPGVPYGAIEEKLAGDAATAIMQPTFSPDGRYLAYISDASGWGHLYLYDLGEGTHTPITSGAHEHGVPAWVQGLRQYGWTGDSGALYYLRGDQGFVTLWRHDMATQTAESIALHPYTHAEQIAVAPTGERVALIVSSPQHPPRLIVIARGSQPQVIRHATLEALPAAELAPLEAITWPGHDGAPVYGLYAPPTNPAYVDSQGKPPLIVMVHGGPTSQRWAAYSAEVQFFATRGFGVLYVNHRGSTGYGKDYMNKHAGGWGLYDVEDSVTGAHYLVAQGRADPHKLIIMGGSAGGYTVLQTLVKHPGVFKAGVNLYGVANLFTLALDTHKFEASYNDWLLGALPGAAALWRERSPIFGAQHIRDACIIFQGRDDPVVPPSQSDAIAAVLRKNNVPHEYHLYDGEGHGFRKPETISDYYAKLLRFLLVQVIYT